MSTPDPGDGNPYCTVVRPGPHPVIYLRRCALIAPGSSGEPREHWFEKDEIAIGVSDESDLVLHDATVSRRHCVVLCDDGGYRLKDLDSRNGSYVDGVRVREGYLRHESVIALGDVRLSFRAATEKIAIEPSPRTRLVDAVGRHPKMRELYAVVDRIAPADATVLLEGETGTGKEVIARALHALSPRAKKPLVIFDCAAVPASLLEAELFGHEKGSFTGATTVRHGMFETAAGGTLFIDEIGELPLDLQARLLRAIERREVRRVGSNTMQHVNARIITATNRDLSVEMNAKRFRADLYYRLVTLRLVLPPLRDRKEDIPHLCRHFLDTLAPNRTPAGAQRVLHIAKGALDALAAHEWPGNVRELLSVIERAVIFADTDRIERRDLLLWGLGDESRTDDATPAPVASIDPRADPATAPAPMDGSFKESKERLVSTFEREYLAELLRKNQGNVTHAAREADLDRRHFRKLMVKYGMESGATGGEGE